jgi:hypothetical protein
MMSPAADRELHGDVFVGDEYGVIGEQQAAVHQGDDKERVVDGERGGSPGRSSAPLDGRSRGDHERTGGIGQDGAGGKVLGHRLARVEVPKRQAGQAHRHHAQAVDAPAEGHRRFFRRHGCRV